MQGLPPRHHSSLEQGAAMRRHSQLLSKYVVSFELGEALRRDTHPSLDTSPGEETSQDMHFQSSHGEASEGFRHASFPIALKGLFSL